VKTVLAAIVLIVALGTVVYLVLAKQKMSQSAAAQPAAETIPTDQTKATPSAPDKEEVSAKILPTPPVPEHVAPPPMLETADSLESAQKLVKDGELVKARQLLTKLILISPEGAEREKLRSELDSLNEKLFYSGEPAADFITHTVEEGESLWTIQKKVKRPLELIRLLNGINNDIVRVGQVLRVPAGKFSAIVDRSHFRMVILLDGQYIKEYPVGIGKDELTPGGTFEIVRKDTNPSWTDPQGHFHKYGDPENQLGTRWLAFKNVGRRSGLGIHGTNDEASIGTRCSNGCVRMHNKDVEEVYGMLLIGDQVTIK
jgi:L,D-transpeptidase ErfK/SrfK